MNEKNGYLISRIRKRAIIGLVIALWVVAFIVVAIIMVGRALSTEATGTAEDISNETKKVVTSISELDLASQTPGFFEVTISELVYVGEQYNGDHLFTAKLPQTGEGVVALIAVNSIADVSDPPAEYRITQAMWGVNFSATDEVREILFDGSYEEFENNYSSNIISEVADEYLESIDVTTQPSGGVATDYIIGLVILIIPLGFILKDIIYLVNPKSHRAYKRLLAGSVDIDRELAAMDAEINGNQKKTVGKTVFTPSWVIDEHSMSLRVWRMNSIIWYYRVNIRNRRHGITVKTYAVSIYDKSGKDYEINTISEKRVDDMMGILSEYNPAAFSGYSQERLQMLARDLNKMVAEVDQRRNT
ncbi:MAG: hypothetical protein LBV33_05090 [Lachnospiraceae bacterium]|jgi:hypothetical protein|nr:hypothetical protein [Lachnospiraceae bacterium]